VRHIVRGASQNTPMGIYCVLKREIFMARHPTHTKKIPNINRAIGQLEAVKRMIESKNYCIDILTQLRAARNAIKSIELGVLEVHMQACLRRSLMESSEQQELKLAEIINLLKKYE